MAIFTSWGLVKIPLFSLWRLLLWKENCHCLRTPTLPCLFFFQKLFSAVFFNHSSDSLWYIYRLNFPIWIWKQLTDQNKRFKAASGSQDINVIMRRAELENVMWVYRGSRFYSNYLLLYNNHFKLGDLKQQQSLISLVSLQLGQGLVWTTCLCSTWHQLGWLTRAGVSALQMAHSYDWQFGPE